MKKKNDLRGLFSKFIKISARVDSQRSDISKRSKDLIETEQQLRGISDAIFKDELKLYNINLHELHGILVSSKSLEEGKINSILQTCLKHADSIYVGKKSTPEENIIEVISCTCEGRMNLCVSSDDSLPECPILSKPICDGKKLYAVFVKRK